MRWIKYTEAFPVQSDSGILEYILVTDGADIWKSIKGSVVSENKTGSMTHWMPMPNLPEKITHWCKNPDSSPLLSCKEYGNEDLRIVLNGLNGALISFPVKYCPFCGFTLEK